MKLSEFDKIRQYLPDDMEIFLEEAIYPAKEDKPPIPHHTLKPEYWGNHDGRYNARCTACGWRSDDIRADKPMPDYCPKCGGLGKAGDRRGEEVES